MANIVSKQPFVCFLGNLIWGSFGTRFEYRFGTLFGGLLKESKVFGASRLVL